MATRRFNINPLIDNGGRIIPWKIILDYAYNRIVGLDKQAYINIYGTKVSDNPVTVCVASMLYIPTEEVMQMTRYTSSIIDVSDLQISGIWCEIVNAEYLDLKRISFAYKQAAIPSGEIAELNDGIPRILYYQINNGNIFSYTQEVELNNTCTNSPTHYRASRFIGFNDAVWTTYSTAPKFQLYSIGSNRIYFQVKNAIGESDVLYRDIGWHGFEELSISDTFVRSGPTFEEIISVGNAVEHYESMSDTVEFDSASFSEIVDIYCGV
jgi:hypothetical protein